MKKFISAFTAGALGMVAILAVFYAGLSIIEYREPKVTNPNQLIPVAGSPNHYVLLDNSLTKKIADASPRFGWRQPLLHPTLPPKIIPAAILE